MMGLFLGAIALLLALQTNLALDWGPGGHDEPTDQPQATSTVSSTGISGTTVLRVMATLANALAVATFPEVGGHNLEEASQNVGTTGNREVYVVTTSDGDESEVSTSSKGGHEATTSNNSLGATTGPGEVIAVGDPRYGWQAWSKWHCNCKTGSMSRVRDITYLVPGLQLNPDNYNAMRFQRAACSYRHCKCSRKHHECDHDTVTCDAPSPYLCAVRDIRQARYFQAQRFWRRVRMELRGLWKSIQKAFSELEEEHS